MPTSFEGLHYTRHLFKPLKGSKTGGCHADIYLPQASEPCPVALAIHGGGFCTGDTFHIFLGHVKYLIDRGFCVVSVEYRLAPHCRFREMREDWLDAYRWVKSELHHVAPVDPSRVFVFGGSAGGTATLFLALDAHTARLPPPQALYVVYPVVDWDDVWPRTTQIDYGRFGEIVSTLSQDDRALLREMIDGPVTTAYDCKNEESRPKTGKRVWYDLVRTHPCLISCILEQPAPPYSESAGFLPHVSSSFPPTIFVKALADTMVPPEETTKAYNRLRELGVETEQIEARDMLHGDAEGENDMAEHPAREEVFWREVFNVALDWCIART